jgi:hypothetical protein
MTGTEGQYFKNYFWYDPETGELYWKIRPGKENDGFNRRWANQPAFTAVNKHGYRHGLLFRKPFLAHRVIWAMVYGSYPRGQIRHLNGNKSDNRISNLLSAAATCHLYRPSKVLTFRN